MCRFRIFSFAALPLALAAITPFQSVAKTADDANLSPHLELRPADPGTVRWNGGSWGDRFELCNEIVKEFFCMKSL